MKIGNTSFTPAAFVGVSREEFIKRYRGKLDGADINEAFDKIQNENKKNEPKEIKKPRIK
jgi:hypothetical protein